MSKESTVAPKERVNIVYKSSTGNAQSEVELPLKILMVGDYTGREDQTPVEERAPINVNKDNFNDVLASQKLGVTINVPNKLEEGESAGELSVALNFNTLSDFGPEGVVNQVPELKKLLELRSALNALKGPLGNMPTFRKKIQTLLSDETQRLQLIAELGLSDEEKK